MKTIIRTVTTLSFLMLMSLNGISNEGRITDDIKQYKYNDNFSSYDVQVKGAIKVNKDDSGIERISPGVI